MPASYHATWIGQSENSTVAAGAVTTLVVRFRNTGTAPWIRGVPGQQANLGVTGGAADLASSSWPTVDRATTQYEDLVQPGEIATFVLQVRAPQKPGTYRLDVRPVIDGTTWMEDEGVFFLVTTSESPVFSNPVVASFMNAFATVSALVSSDPTRTMQLGGALIALIVVILVIRALVMAIRSRALSRAASRA